VKRTGIDYIAEGTGGVIAGRAAGDKYVSVTSVAIDSRKIEEETLFFAIIGARSDGHTFLPDVRESGCHNVVVSDKAWAERMAGYGDMNVILVDDTVSALDALTQKYLEDWQSLGKVAVTGSAGKTTTKEFLYSILSQKYKTAKNEGNLNSETGIPLAVFRYPEDSEIAVVEIGIGEGPDMRELAQMVKPDNAVVTNVGTVHMEYFESSREKLLEAKLRVTLGFGPENTLVVNNCEENLSIESIRAHTEDPDFRIITVGNDDECDFRISDIEDRGIDGVRGKLTAHGKTYNLELPIIGAHNLYNAAEAIAMGEVYGIEIADSLEAVRNIDMAGNRLDVRRGRYIILNDSYNANPEAMKAAIDIIRNSKASRKGLIVGDMRELGDETKSLHEDVGRYIARGGIDYVAAVGELGRIIGETASAENESIEVRYFEDAEEASEKIGEFASEGDLILLKASNSMNLSIIAEAAEK